MRIVHLSTHDITGGAARAAYRLHGELLRFGYDSSMLVADRKSNDPTVIALKPRMDLATRIRRRLRAECMTRSFSRYLPTRPEGYEKFSDDRSLHWSSLLSQLPPCDVVNLHWIADFVDYRGFFPAVPRHIPVFWRLSDMNAFTGGCHFDHGCGRHTTGCGTCPQLGSTDTNDLSHQTWQRKQTVFSRLAPEQLHIIALNRWMASTVSQSPLLGKFPVTVVPNGVDTRNFAPRDRKIVRDQLGIPQEAQVVLFAANEARNRRKGFHLVVEALSEMHDIDHLFLLSVGHGTPSIKTRTQHLHLGHIDNDRLLSLVYSAADLYVMPSLQDNQPNTVLEAMACGIPVVGFDVGGVADMVRSGITGLLIRSGDVHGLRAAMVELLRHPEKRAAMAAASLQTVMEDYTLKMQIERYMKLYGSALESRKRSA